MNSMKIALGIGLVALVAGLSVTRLPAAAPSQSSPLRIGVVNLRDCLDEKSGYEKVAEVLREFKSRKAKIEAELERLNKDISTIKSKLESLTPTTNPDSLYNLNRRELAKLTAQFKAMEDTGKLELREFLRMTNSEIHDELSAAAAAVAKEKGLDLVLKDYVADPSSSEEEKARMPPDLRVILHSSDNLDITKEVLAKLKAEYDKKKGPGKPPGK